MVVRCEVSLFYQQKIDGVEEWQTRKKVKDEPNTLQVPNEMRMKGMEKTCPCMIESEKDRTHRETEMK